MIEKKIFAFTYTDFELPGQKTLNYCHISAFKFDLVKIIITEFQEGKSWFHLISFYI